MTPNGKRCMEILISLAEKDSDREGWFTAKEVTARFRGLSNRVAPVMTISSYLTHLKRKGYVERQASTDKQTAWWRPTDKGLKAYHA